MSGLEDTPERVYRAIFLGIVLYFVLFGYATIANDPLALFASEFVFGVVAVGVGTVLFLQADRSAPAILGASLCLVAGGVLQFAHLFSRLQLLDDASSIAVFVGIGLYIVAVWLE
ncbi:hypothetical protein [Natrarchaeobius chitinivorans]|uniref:Uncharacterized protein n=1 Tax=Natrarchaeobius chitinivorans TaxID=1679083 RepID=A0A3N6M3C7_NATCH|nr:hypothetical protein [Natrarchaeobius chitinivorans]RQG97968.1 hypothetical protein EA473_01895 [Natrarchaeobius chitinivorans]